MATGTTDARVAHILGDDLPARRPSATVLIVSVAGADRRLARNVLGQAGLAGVGLP